MSKQEKLAALIESVRAFDAGEAEWTDVVERINSYDDAPDDPPQPPEMPECVAKLLQTFQPVGQALVNAVQAVRDHYRQPLKLEVGNAYRDADGGDWEIVYKSQDGSDFCWLGVSGSVTNWYRDGGLSWENKLPNLIRPIS
jgi:hypothetical protein